MKSKEKYNDKWIAYYFLPLVAIFTYYIGDDTPFYQDSFEVKDLMYIGLNFISGFIVWQVIRKILFKFVKDELNLVVLSKAFAINLLASLFFLIVTRILYDFFVRKIRTPIEFYTLDLPTDVLFIFIINLFYLILFYNRKIEQKTDLEKVESGPSNKIVIQGSKKSYALSPSDIAFIELEDKITFVHTYSGEKMATVYSLSKIFKKLPPQSFFLANRQFILNRNVILSYQLTDTRKLRIQLLPAVDFKKDIFVSKAKSHEFKSWFMDNHLPKKQNFSLGDS